MTKISKITADRAATEYLLTLYEIAHDFHLDEQSAYVKQHLHKELEWINQIIYRSQRCSGPLSKWRKLRIRIAALPLNKENASVVDVKLGLADDLITIYGLIRDYETLVRNYQHFNITTLDGTGLYAYTHRINSGDRCWEKAVGSAMKEYDERCIELIGIYRELIGDLDKLRHEILMEAYGDPMNTILGSARMREVSNRILPYVDLRRITCPVRRLGSGTFQYKIFKTEEDFIQRLYAVRNAMHQADDVYYSAVADLGATKIAYSGIPEGLHPLLQL